jgi:hypothetical protein
MGPFVSHTENGDCADLARERGANHLNLAKSECNSDNA